VQRRKTGWGGWIRTTEYGIQSPAPYRLATPQRSCKTRIIEEVLTRRGSTTAAQTKSLYDGRTYRQVQGRRRGWKRVIIVAAPPRFSLRAAAFAACRDSNTPNTVDPLPDIAAIDAPSCISLDLISAIIG
jgi:hypothetical protein